MLHSYPLYKYSGVWDLDTEDINAIYSTVEPFHALIVVIRNPPTWKRWLDAVGLMSSRRRLEAVATEISVIMNVKDSGEIPLLEHIYIYR